MTAAHCVENDDVKSLTVRLGVWDIKNNNVGKTVALKSIKIHEGYSKYTHDVAILELSTPVKFDKTIRPVCMPAENSLKDYNGQETIAAGWGYTLGKRDGKLSKLREAKVNVVTNKECKKYVSKPFVIESLICTRPAKTGKAACGGDSGGPLMLKQGKR